MSIGRILVVDDEEITRTSVNDYFEELGYDVVVANDGEDALKKFSPERFECVISDLVMPKIDGMALLKNLKQQDPKIMFLMITGYPSIDRAIDAMKAGAYDYVTKPFHMEDIRIKVERVLNDRKQKKSLKTMTGLLWGLIISIPVWLIMGIIFGAIWK